MVEGPSDYTFTPLDSAKDVFQVLRGVLRWTGGPSDWLRKRTQFLKGGEKVETQYPAHHRPRHGKAFG